MKTKKCIECTFNLNDKAFVIRFDERKYYEQTSNDVIKKKLLEVINSELDWMVDDISKEVNKAYIQNQNKKKDEVEERSRQISKEEFHEQTLNNLL